MQKERMRGIIWELLMAIDDNCYEFSEKVNILKQSGITLGELNELGFDYMCCWLEDCEEE